MDRLLLFNSTREVIKAEGHLRDNDIPCRVVPAPTGVDSLSGMVVSVGEEYASRAETLLSEIGLIPQRLEDSARKTKQFDLLTTVDQGGCSAKLPPDLLFQAVHQLSPQSDANLLVGIDTCDDAGVYKLTDVIALIETTDFFPPVCSDPYDFGQIAAANAMSDVYAMGGRVLTAMNIVMFPASGVPHEALIEIIRGGQDKVREAGGVIVGGHSIADYPPKYGLAVTGIVHPDLLVSNAAAEPDQVLILTKRVGTGAIVAGKRVSRTSSADYEVALDSMRQLNRNAAEVMQEFGIRAATDVTGFGLLGHALNIARGSRVSLEIDARRVPALPGALELLEAGCIPGAAFRNLDYVGDHLEIPTELPYHLKMLTLDPQTSGGILLCAPRNIAHSLLAEIRTRGCPFASIVGRTAPLGDKYLRLV